jgi:hypothetical protein
MVLFLSETVKYVNSNPPVLGADFDATITYSYNYHWLAGTTFRAKRSSLRQPPRLLEWSLSNMLHTKFLRDACHLAGRLYVS